MVDVIVLRKFKHPVSGIVYVNGSDLLNLISECAFAVASVTPETERQELTAAGMKAAYTILLGHLDSLGADMNVDEMSQFLSEQTEPPKDTDAK